MTTLFELINENAEKFSEKTAFSSNNGEQIEEISFKEFFEQVKIFATALLHTNGGKANIGICMKNCYQWVVTYFASAIGAGIACPVDFAYSKNEILNVVKSADIRCIVADESVTKLLLDCYDELPADFVLVTTSQIADARVVYFDELTELGKQMTKDDVNLLNENLNEADETAVLMFTSGSNSSPKAVMLSNKNIISDMLGLSGRVDISPKDRTLCTLPLFHSYQLMVMLVMFSVGGSISFCKGPRYYAKDMSLYKPTVIATVPLILEKTHKKIYQKLLSQGVIKRALTVGKLGTILSKFGGEAKKIVYSQVHKAFGGSLRFFIVGGAQMNAEIARDFRSFGFPVVIGYGLTECSPIVTANSLKKPVASSVGAPIEGAEIKIYMPNDDGIGEILVHGDMVMKGYYKNPDLTARTIVNGWLHTGDLGYIGQSGNLHITGRIKNIIVSKNGKNIYPEEIEDALRVDPIILDTLIFADDDEDDGEVVVAEIVPNEEMIQEVLNKTDVTDEEIEVAIENAVSTTNMALPKYKRIRRFKIKRSLKKTTSSKTKRK